MYKSIPGSVNSDLKSSTGIIAFRFDLIITGFFHLLAGSRTSTSSTTATTYFSPSFFCSAVAS